MASWWSEIPINKAIEICRVFYHCPQEFTSVFYHTESPYAEALKIEKIKIYINDE